MTARMNRRGQLVLHTTAQEKLNLRSGDAFVVVVHDEDGRIVLQRKPAAGTNKTRGKDYLNPPPLPVPVLERMYRSSEPEWDKNEAEAATVGQRALKGNLLRDL